MIDFSDVEIIIKECYDELSTSSRSTYDQIKADKTAALFLVAQMKASMIIENFELQAKNSKTEISRLEGEKYFEYKSSYDAEKKITENILFNYVAKDKDVIQAKKDNAQSEANLKKWLFILNTLKDGHHYFKNISKAKNWAE